MTVEEAPGRGQARVIGLIALAHGASHFYQLALPPLFPHLKEAFAVSYTELGTLMTVFYVTSGAAQTAAGFLVDRFSAGVVLLSGLALLCIATALTGLAPAFWMLFPLAALAGLGNSVFHPADLSILTASVRRTRHGRAYGFHTLGGNLGYALAPIVMVGLALELGWRSALIVAGAGGLVLFLVLFLNRHMFADGRAEAAPAHRPLAAGEAAAGTPRRGTLAAVREGVAPLFSVPVALCFVFFVLLSGATIGLQSFFPALMDQLYGLPIAEGGPLLSLFLFGASGGVLLGGFLAERAAGRLQVVIGGGLAAAAALFVAVSFGGLPGRHVGRPLRARRHPGRRHHAVPRHAGARDRGGARQGPGLRLRLFGPRHGRRRRAAGGGAAARPRQSPRRAVADCGAAAARHRQRRRRARPAGLSVPRPLSPSPNPGTAPADRLQSVRPGARPGVSTSDRWVA